jgi:aspartate aminotransferase
MGPPDPILGLTEAFNKDTDPRKVNLGVGAYRGDDGKPYILPSVRQAEEALLAAKLNHEYAGIAGVQEFVNYSLKFVYGANSKPLADGRVAAIQVLSGTGACRVIGDFYARFLGRGSRMYQTNPTWANHIPIFKDAGLDIHTFRYYDPKTCGLDFKGMMDDIKAAPEKSIFLMHACAHNPTGVDPTLEQWKEISALMKQRQHYVFMDMAYQGFASGDAERDAGAVRVFVDDGHLLAVGQSFAKNFGLYGERVGCLSIVGQDTDEKARLESQLKILVRPMYSNPPVHGARIVARILSDDKLSKQWYSECKGMADRIITMRDQLKAKLEKNGSTRNWNHITSQIGMFCYTGLTKEQCDRMIKEFHIYLTGNGRISMAGVTSGNVGYVADAIHACTK